MIKLEDSLITDILPHVLGEPPEVKAIAYAIKQEINACLYYMSRAMIYSDIDSLDEGALDTLAVEIRAPYYDNDFPIATKREIIKGTFDWNAQAGTISAIEGLVSAVSGPTEVFEWFDYEGDPYHFKVQVSMDGAVTPEQRQLVSRLVNTYKNVRSYVDSIEFIQIGAEATMHAFTSVCGFTMRESSYARKY